MQAREQTHPVAPAAPVRWDRVLRRLQSLKLWVELIRNLATRDVETRYKHSLLGLYWALINPLVMASIYGFVFKVIFHASSKPIPYVVFLVTGITFWNFFANGAISATNSVSGNASLLAKIYFPRVVLPTAAVLARLIDFLFSVVILGIFILLYHVPIHWSAFWLVPLVALQVVFTLGIGYMLAALNVLYRDMSQLIGLLLMAWIYFSPVMYAITTAPPTVKTVLLSNPMGAILQSERDLLFTGHLLYPQFLWTAVAWTAFVFIAGLTLFKRIEPLFAEVM